MHFANILCYLIVVITVSTTSAEPVKDQTDSQLLQSERRINKREATVIIDSYPLQHGLKHQKPNVRYRRMSTPQRYGPPPTHKYGPPKMRSKTYKSSKLNRKPGKKYGGNKQKRLSPKYLAAYEYNSKQFHDTKPRYGPPSKPKRQPVNPKAKKPLYNPIATENMGFAEPPTNYANEYQPPKQTYGEPPVASYGVPPVDSYDLPPVDSYGVPLKLNNNKPTAPQIYEESNNYYVNENNQEYPDWGYNQDISGAYSKKQSFFAKPEASEGFSSFTSLDYNDDLEGMRPTKTQPQYFTGNSKIINRPWNIRPDREADDVIVGGQYAEPPARYVSKFQPSAPMFKEDENTFLPLSNFMDREIGSSAKTSPYVNYKNSNLAFSPQNLNDAFSIVDK